MRCSYLSPWLLCMLVALRHPGCYKGVRQGVAAWKAEGLLLRIKIRSRCCCRKVTDQCQHAYETAQCCSTKFGLHQPEGQQSCNSAGISQKVQALSK